MEKNDADIREKLLEHADNLARTLRQYGHNELKKAVEYFIRHQREPNAYEKLLELLRLNPPKYSRTVVSDWHNIGKKLKKEKDTLTKYESKHTAFVLGWTARLVRYYSGQLPQNSPLRGNNV